jgi:hypothetical protein
MPDVGITTNSCWSELSVEFLFFCYYVPLFCTPSFPLDYSSNVLCLLLKASPTQ